MSTRDQFSLAWHQLRYIDRLAKERDRAPNQEIYNTLDYSYKMNLKKFKNGAPDWYRLVDQCMSMKYSSDPLVRKHSQRFAILHDSPF